MCLAPRVVLSADTSILTDTFVPASLSAASISWLLKRSDKCILHLKTRGVNETLSLGQSRLKTCSRNNYSSERNWDATELIVGTRDKTS